MRFGYHVRMAGGPISALVEGVDAGCEAIQMFPGSPQQWGTPPVSDEQAAEFIETKASSGIDPVLLHAIYLINMAAPSDSIFKRSVGSLASALAKADKLGATAVISHIGNHKGEGEEFGLKRIAEAVDSCLERSPGDPMLLLETTAGAGTSIGDTFEQFGAVFDMAGRPERLGFCLDTCHVFAAGYDISTPAGVDDALDELDHYIGLDRLKALHLNDSRGECGSHLDRHEHIGQGMIGLESFRHMVNHPALLGLPAIIELPYENRDEDSLGDISLLRSLVEP
ncbi:MAG TPA: deoxyribonuclease IV [Candidatus Anoxymicrobiaceae bacterium]